MKVALVHDDFVQRGGAESLFAAIAELYPDAAIYTSLVNWKKLPASISRGRIKTSFIQKIPFAAKFYKVLLPLYPLAFESFDFSGYDIVISSTTRFAKSIITKPETLHICYINSVPRFLWDRGVFANYLPGFAAIVLRPFFSYLRRWDKVASSRVDFYIANSKNAADDVEKYYGRKAFVVWPFVDLDFFKVPKVHNWQLKSQDYYLVVSRLVRWKKIETAIEAALTLGINLKIIGDGPDAGRLKKLAKSANIEFLGRVNRQTLCSLYQNAKALIVTQEEDFGIAAVEAGACGIPVIAYKKGGSGEIIEDGKTGVLFDSQSAQSLIDAINAASRVKWEILQIRKNALRFRKSNFLGNLERVVSNQNLKIKNQNN